MLQNCRSAKLPREELNDRLPGQFPLAEMRMLQAVSHCRGTSAPQAFFPGGGDTLRAVPGRIRAHSQSVPGRIRAHSNPFPSDSRPSQPAPGPNSHAARTVPATRDPGCPPAESRPPERQSRRACDSAGESPGQRCKGGSEAGNSDRRSTKPPWHRPVWDRFGRSGSDRPAAGENRTPHAADNPDAGASNGDGRDDPAKALRQPSVVSTTCR